MGSSLDHYMSFCVWGVICDSFDCGKVAGREDYQ